MAEGYIFHPYNLLDEKKYVTIEFSETVDLDFWGNVELAVGKYDTGRRYHGVAYLINSDGLMDIKLIERFEADDIEDFEWCSLQKENGLFYLEK